MCLFNKKNKRQKQKSTDINRKVHKNSPEVRKARAYLEKLYPALQKKSILKRNFTFNFIEATKNGEYVRYHFREGNDCRLTFIVLSDKEIEKVSQLFKEKFKEKVDNVEDFTYIGSLKGIFIGYDCKHRFLCESSRLLAFMSDDGEIDFPYILEPEDMD